MKLNRISIKNYRSIYTKLTLDFTQVEESCYFLFGINETGKSNILRACALMGDISEQEKYSWSNDCHKEKKVEGSQTEIDYYFTVGEEELSDLRDLTKDKIPDALLSSINEIWYWLEGRKDRGIVTGTKIIFNESFDDFNNYLIKEISTPSTPASPTPTTTREILKKDDIPAEEWLAYTELNEETAEDIILELIETYLNGKKPKIIHWDIHAKNLIDGPIDLNTFKFSPQNCVPLYNMFKLIGINTQEKIAACIDSAISDSTDRKSLEKKLSMATTRHLNTVWKEHDVEISVSIEASGLCEVHFFDKDSETNIFAIKDRSDGFQRFISFILTLSAENINSELRDSVILLDEPEVHLHPSGIEYLRDELLSISKNNNSILAASHSIFLVDKKCISRHITVKKEKNKTSIEYLQAENPFKEEVVYRALNTSILEIACEFYVIFEGTIDADIFLLSARKMNKDLPALSSIGAIGATSATEVGKYSKFFRANHFITAIAVFDSDNEGRDNYKNLIESSDFFNKNNVFLLEDLLKFSKKTFVLEDLFPQSLVLKAASDFYKNDFLSEEIDDKKPILDEIKRIKQEKGIEDDKKLKEFKSNLAKLVLKDIQKTTIKNFKVAYANYYLFLQGLEEAVKNTRKS